MKTIIKIFICLSLIYTPMFANAAKVGGWNLSNPVAQGASTVYDATKNVLINGKDFVKKSTVKITPTASQVSKVLLRGAAGYALSVAVEQLLGSVDWVLDPANNQIRYTNPNNNDPSKPPNVPYVYYFSISGVKQYYSTFNAAAIADADYFTSDYNRKYPSRQLTYVSHTSPTWQDTETTSKSYVVTVSATSGKNPDTYTRSVTRAINPSYDPTEEEEEQEKTLPLDVVSQQVISNAEGGDSNAQVATTSAAADVVAEAQKDDSKARPIANQAEANAETKPADEDAAANANTGAATATPQADPVTGEQAPPTDIALEFPVFCNWAPTICEAAQVVISFPNTLTGWYNDTKTKSEEWATSISEAYHDFMNDDELPNDDTKVDITNLPTPELKEDAISWGASCPADVSIPISMQGVSSTLVFSWSPWCQLLSIIKPAIIASAYIGAAFIVLGLRT